MIHLKRFDQLDDGAVFAVPDEPGRSVRFYRKTASKNTRFGFAVDLSESKSRICCIENGIPCWPLGWSVLRIDQETVKMVGGFKIKQAIIETGLWRKFCGIQGGKITTILVADYQYSIEPKFRLSRLEAWIREIQKAPDASLVASDTVPFCREDFDATSVSA